jgi:hypothetical protein
MIDKTTDRSLMPERLRNASPAQQQQFLEYRRKALELFEKDHAHLKVEGGYLLLSRRAHPFGKRSLEEMLKNMERLTGRKAELRMAVIKKPEENQGLYSLPKSPPRGSLQPLGSLPDFLRSDGEVRMAVKPVASATDDKVQRLRNALQRGV